MSSQFAFLLLSRLGAAALQAIGFIVLSRSVSISDFGWVGVLTGLGAFIMLLSDFGLTPALSRARARGENKLVRGFLRVNDWAMLPVGLAFMAITALTLDELPALVLLVATIVVERNSETQLSVFYADGSRLVPAASVLGRRAIALAVFIGLISLDQNGLWSFCIGQLAGAAFSQAYQRICMHRLEIGPDRQSLGVLFRAAWPFWMSSVLNQVRLLDTAVVAVFASSVSAGLYSAALKLTGPLLLIPASLSQVLLPYASRPGSNLVRASTRITLVFLSSYVLLVPACVLSEEILSFLYGPSFGPAAPILVWMLLGLPVLALSGPLAAILQGCGSERFVALNGGIFAVVMVAAMALGAAADGPTGVAAGLAIASAARVPVLLLRIYSVGRPA